MSIHVQNNMPKNGGVVVASDGMKFVSAGVWRAALELGQFTAKEIADITGAKMSSVYAAIGRMQKADLFEEVKLGSDSPIVRGRPIKFYQLRTSATVQIKLAHLDMSAHGDNSASNDGLSSVRLAQNEYFNAEPNVEPLFDYEKPEPTSIHYTAARYALNKARSARSVPEKGTPPPRDWVEDAALSLNAARRHEQIARAEEGGSVASVAVNHALDTLLAELNAETMMVDREKARLHRKNNPVSWSDVLARPEEILKQIGRTPEPVFGGCAL